MAAQPQPPSDSPPPTGPSARLSGGPPPDHVERRLQKLEEAQAFADRAVEDLSAEVLDLRRRLEQATRALESLRRKLDTALAPPEEVAGEGPKDPSAGGGGPGPASDGGEESRT